MHGAAAPQVKARAEQQVAADRVRSAAANLGSSVEMPPEEALLGQLHEAVGNVAFLRRMVQQVDLGDLVSSGAVSSQARSMIDVYNKERDRLVKIAAVCLSSGVQDRIVRLAERHGEAIAHAVMSTLQDRALGLSDVQIQTAKAGIAANLRAMDSQ